MPSKNLDLGRQKTYDCKTQNDKFVGKRSIATVNNQRAHQQQIYYDRVSSPIKFLGFVCRQSYSRS